MTVAGATLRRVRIRFYQRAGVRPNFVFGGNKKGDPRAAFDCFA
jgi:hypothetical protein